MHLEISIFRNEKKGDLIKVETKKKMRIITAALAIATLAPVSQSITFAENVTAIKQQMSTSEQLIQDYDKKANALYQLLAERKETIQKYTFKIERFKQQMKENTENLDEHKLEFEKISKIYFENGENIGLIDVMSEAATVKDFFNRLLSYKSIAQKEVDFIKKYIGWQDQIKKDRDSVEATKKKINQLREEIKALEPQLLQVQSEKDVHMDKLKSQSDHLEEIYEMEKAEEAAIAKAQENIEALQQNAEEERGKLEAQYKLYKEMTKLRREVRAGNPPTDNSNGQNTSQQQDIVWQELEDDGRFIRPTTGRVTSEFGQRDGRLHAGVDIGKNGRTGPVPVVAAADGVILRSYYSSSYGNVVFIRHTFGKETYTTVYAHLENRAVQAGGYVKKGMFLGNMGNTGRSFGAHLHFEVHRGEWLLSKTNAMDPLNFIPR